MTSQALALLVLLAGCSSGTNAPVVTGSCGAAGPGTVDQSNGAGHATRVVNSTKSLSQTFVAGMTGRLVGLELALHVCTSLPSGGIFRVTVSDENGKVLGAGDIGLPTKPSCPSSDGAFGPTPGNGYANLDAACIQVSSGSRYRFDITLEGYGKPVCTEGRCSSGPLTGLTGCGLDSFCDIFPEVFASTNMYPGGAMSYVGMEEPEADVLFRTFVK